MKIIKNGAASCPLCGCKKFSGHQIIRANVYVDENGQFLENMEGGLESNIYDSEDPYGPFQCVNCGFEYDELPKKVQVVLPRGTFTVVDMTVAKELKEQGYGYHHDEEGFTVVGNGMRAFAMQNHFYDVVYGRKRSFLIL